MKNDKAITLISLVITIIILIILSSIGISLSIGKSGIFIKAKNSKKQMEIEMIKEQIQIDILDKQSENEGKISYNSLEQILLKYGTLSNEENTIDKTLTTTKEKYKIKVSDIYNGEIEYEKFEIKSFEVIDYTFNTISVEVKAMLAEEYEFYIGEDEENYQKIDNIKTSAKGIKGIEIINYTYSMKETLKVEDTYYLKVIAKNGNNQEEKTTTITIKYKDALTGSVSGESSNTRTYTDTYLPLMIVEDSMDEYFTYENNIITFKKDCIVRIKGRRQNITDSTWTVSGYYLNRIKPNDNSNAIYQDNDNFDITLSIHANDYLIIIWKAMHNVYGYAGSEYKGKIDIQVQVL